jgi:uncharacterized membrane protein
MVLRLLSLCASDLMHRARSGQFRPCRCLDPLMNPAALPSSWAPDVAVHVPDRAVQGGVVAPSRRPVSAAWRLQRQCALTPMQFGRCFAALALVSGLVGGLFWLLGAPYISLFCGLEVLVVAVAFLVHARGAADGDCLQVEGDTLRVEMCRWGRVDEAVFALSTLRVGWARDGSIELTAGRQGLHIGRHATAARRAAVMNELRRTVLSSGAAAPVKI